MPIRPKAIFVGPEKIGTVLAGLRKEWDFQIVPNIAKLWEGLNNQSINNDIQIMITLDGFFKPDTNENDPAFEQMVSVMSPYCFFCILQYYPNREGAIRDRIAAQDNANSIADELTNSYFFINPKQPNVTIDRALAQYVQTTPNKEIAAILQGKDIEELDTNDENDEIETPYTDNEQKSNYLGQVLAITSSKGGSGKSTVATVLATYLAHSSINSVREKKAEKPLKIVILDLDIRDGQIGFLTGNHKPTVLHMRTNGIDSQTLSETVIHSERLKVDLLLAPKRPRLSDDTPAEFYLELIQFLKLNYDYVILDTSVNYLDPLLEKVAYPIADQIVFVSDIVINSIFSMTRWIQEVTKPKKQNGMGINAKKIGVVVNKSMANINMDGKKIAKSACGLPILTVIPNNAKLLAHAANLTAMEAVLQHEDIRSSFRDLAKKIVGSKYPLSKNVEN